MGAARLVRFEQLQIPAPLAQLRGVFAPRLVGEFEGIGGRAPLYLARHVQLPHAVAAKIRLRARRRLPLRQGGRVFEERALLLPARLQKGALLYALGRFGGGGGQLAEGGGEVALRRYKFFQSPLFGAAHQRGRRLAQLPHRPVHILDRLFFPLV